MMGDAWIVFCKELVDALRDRRTLAVVLASAVALGPLLLLMLSVLVSDSEERAQARDVVVQGIEHAPTLHNYLLRQTYSPRLAPPDYEQRLRDSLLGDPVIVVGRDFETELARGEQPLVEIVHSSGNRRVQNQMRRMMLLLEGYNREQATLRLTTRGVSPAALQALQVEERDVGDPATRGAQLTILVPYFVLMAVLYGALNAALDSTAGERERGSLEPLLMNPAARIALVLGKWGAVAGLAMMIAVLSCLSFVPGQWLLQSETLSALFRFGAPEALRFIALLLPLAGALAAVLMAIAIRCRTYKEAQANATMVLLAVSLLPLLSLLNQEGERPWHLWVPALAQVTLMGRVLRGEALGWPEVGLTLGVSALVAAGGLAYVARKLRTAAVQ